MLTSYECWYCDGGDMWCTCQDEIETWYQEEIGTWYQEEIGTWYQEEQEDGDILL